MFPRRPVTLAYPKGTHSTVPFYFRGDDIYKEQEFLISELLHSQSAFRQSSQDFEQQQIEYNEILQQFQACGAYAVKIAVDLGGPSAVTTAHAALLQEISALENSRCQLETELSRYQVLANPIEQDRLEKEYATNSLSVENLNRNLRLLNRSHSELRKEMARIASTLAFQKAQCSAMEARVAEQCCHRIQQQLFQLHNSLNTAPSEPTAKRTASANAVLRTFDPITRLFDARTEINLELLEMELKKRLAMLHRRHAVKSAVQTIVSLNAILAKVGCDPVDIEAVRGNCDIEKIEADERMSRGRTNPPSMNTSARAEAPKMKTSARRRRF